MQNERRETIILALAGIILLLFFGTVIVIYVLMYNSRKREQEFSKMRHEIEERTFQMISHEIHDNVGQLLSLARVQINWMNESGHMDKVLLLQVKDLIGRAMAELRDLAKSLNSERITNHPLHETLQQECESISRSGIIYTSVTVGGEIRDIGGQQKLVIFRVIQEVIQNCIKHARATHILISLSYDSNGISITASDDGQGFDVTKALDRNPGLGLSNIRRRTALAKASCTIDSHIGKGTTVRIYVPYT